METNIKDLMKKIELKHTDKFSENDQTIINQIAIKLLNNQEFMAKVQNNSRENIEAVFGKYLDEAMFDVFHSNTDLIQKLNNNPELMKEVKEFIQN